MIRAYLKPALLIAGMTALAACQGTAQSPGTDAGAGTDPGDPGAAVSRYYAALGAGDHAAAYAMWTPDSDTALRGLDRFSQSMQNYQSLAAAPAGPARLETTAGTVHAEVPVRVEATYRGNPITSTGTVTLERCNDVPGCSAAERQWRLDAIALDPQ
ncbi:hypothetical protein [Frigidibacter oleivorans]|uniref:hypothetical protein n=1 Tax=Frigidibacter oleivorans TaxID=2487129 RepID=UPI000F8F7009|nr:hypothetical protein [Frigidibacter oleivorans]